MIVAPVAASTPASTVPNDRPGEFIARSVDDLQRLDAAPDGAAKELFRDHSSRLLGMLGVSWVSWTIREPDQLSIYFTDEDLMRLGDNVLRDTVRGATLALRLDPSPTATPKVTPAGSTDTAKIPWYDRPSNVARAISVLPGVWKHETDHRTGMISFFMTNKRDSEALKEIISPYFFGYAPSFVNWVPRPRP